MYSMYVMCCLYEDVCVSVSSPLDKRSKGFIEHLIDSALGHNRYKHIHSSSPSCLVRMSNALRRIEAKLAARSSPQRSQSRGNYEKLKIKKTDRIFDRIQLIIAQLERRISPPRKVKDSALLVVLTPGHSRSSVPPLPCDPN